MWGKSFVDVLDQEGTEHTVVLRSLSIQENNYLNYMYNKELKNAQSNGILSCEQLKLLFEAQEIWGPDQEAERESLQKEKILIGNQLKSAEFNTNKKKQLTKRLKDIEEKIKDLNQYEVELFALSAENRAEEVKRRYMVCMFTETVEEKPFWQSKEEFIKSTDSRFLNNLILGYFRNNIYPEKDLRSIARSPEWRFRWIASKHGEQLFGKPIAQWSEMQNMLVYWSEYYDSIYDSIDRPADYIIEDDAACDAWLQNYNKKITNDRLNNKKDKKQGKLNHNERFVMVPKGDNEAVQKVQSLNPDQVRDKLRREFEQIQNSKGRIKEWSLGDRNKTTQVNKRKGKK